MKLTTLGDIQLRYTAIELIDYGSGGQIYGTMDGNVSGEKLRGTLRLTNLAPRRADNVNIPTLRGVLDTAEGAKIYVEMNGVAGLRPTDQARVFVTSCTFRTGHPDYQWLNAAFVVLEGVLDKVAVGGVARGRMHLCEVTMDGIQS